MNDSRKHALLLSEYSAVQVFYWLGYCCISTYAAVFLQNRGYTNTQLGTITALGNIGGFLLAPALASVIDRSRKIKVYHCLYGLLFLEGLLEVLILFSAGSSIYVSILYCLLMACVVAVSPMNTELCFSMDRTGQYINFGFSRSCGSLAFSIITIILGRLCASYSPELLPNLSIVMILMQIVILTVIGRVRKIVLPADTVQENVPKKAGASLGEFLSRNKRFIAFCIGTSVLMFPSSIMGAFLINIVRGVGGTANSMGIISSIAAFCEVPAMLFYTRITRNVKCSTVIRFAAVMYIVRIATVTFAEDLGMLYFSAVTQMLCYALLIPALVDYASIVVDVNDSAKGQAVSAAMLTLSNILAALVGGILLDRISVHRTMLIGLAVCILGVLICFFTIDSKRA